MQASFYLFFNGQCEEAFRFYEKMLGGTVEVMMNHEGTPVEARVPADWLKKILHARLSIGNTILMGSDPAPGHYEKPQGFFVSLDVDSVAEAERVFNALSDKGVIKMPLDKTFYAERFAMLVDRFGTPWMILYRKTAA